MRRAMILMLFVLTLLPCAAGAASVAVGAFGGMGIPIIQDDNGQGTTFGLRTSASLIPLVTVEPYFVKTSGGDKDQDIEGTTYTRSGLDVTGFGANVLLTFGGKIQFYPFAGIGSYALSRTGSEDVTNTAYTFGLGLGISPMPKLSIHVRGELAAAVDGETSRKWANATVGVSYNVFSTPIP
jgi:opacity protein-like surface antigen